MSIQVFQIGDKHLAVVIGLGLIGQQIFQQLSIKSELLTPPSSPDINWQKPESIIQALNESIKRYCPQMIDIIWSAGKAGFSSSDTDMSKEFDTYSAVMNHLKSIKLNINVNLLSSAGGIYENSNHVKSIDDISPQRPYAFGKLKQENLLHELEINARIYRISSVYGYKTQQGRSGLINAMIEKSLRREPVTIYANQNTLRDYILHTDIARHIVNQVILGGNFETQIIANGRATSINTLLNIVANITKKPIKAIYTGNDNSNDIIFNKSLIPPTLQLTSLEEAIGIVYSRERFL